MYHFLVPSGTLISGHFVLYGSSIGVLQLRFIGDTEVHLCTISSDVSEGRQKSQVELALLRRHASNAGTGLNLERIYHKDYSAAPWKSTAPGFGKHAAHRWKRGFHNPIVSASDGSRGCGNSGGHCVRASIDLSGFCCPHPVSFIVFVTTPCYGLLLLRPTDM